MALNVVYFQFMHRLGRPHYVWDEYLSNENLLPRRGLNPEPAEPEADMLPSEPAREAKI